jgi:hypothetical protein
VKWLGANPEVAVEEAEAEEEEAAEAVLKQPLRQLTQQRFSPRRRQKSYLY